MPGRPRLNLEVLIPRAVAMARDGKKWVQIGETLNVGISTLHRWRKRPEWHEAERACDQRDEELKAQAEEDRLEQRRLTLAMMEEQRRQAGAAFQRTLDVVMDVLQRDPREDKIVKSREVQKPGGTEFIEEVIEKPLVDEAAMLASKLAAGGGLKFLADAAVRGPYVPDEASGDPRRAADAVEAFKVALKDAEVEADDDPVAETARRHTG